MAQLLIKPDRRNAWYVMVMLYILAMYTKCQTLLVKDNTLNLDYQRNIYTKM